MLDYSLEYKRYLNYFESILADEIKNLDSSAPKIILEAMEYAVSGGGKRVRPVLCFASAKMLNVDLKKVERFALAIEMIHSYSLVHDDLPAMDNDDYRRGKLSTHKKFGEQYGILAGDALLNFAFELCLNKEDFSLVDAKALKIISNCAGYTGMIAGQVLDLSNEKNDDINEELLYSIYKNKTAKLIVAPILVASTFADNKHYGELEEFGYNLGALFQIVDDIMDEEGSLESIGKTPHKDKDVGKLTAIKLWGIDGARTRAKIHYDKCKSILSKMEGSEFLSVFTDQMFKRNK